MEVLSINHKLEVVEHIEDNKQDSTHSFYLKRRREAIHSFYVWWSRELKCRKYKLTKKYCR